MIIRPHLKSHFVALPNSLLNDRRLSADTRAMIALLLSKPRGWELHPVPLMKQLSRAGEKGVGRTRLQRMLIEATAAGYIARTLHQGHDEDGKWDKYEYFVGMPEDVRRAVQEADVAIAPHPREPLEGDPSAQNDFTSHKEQTSERTESKNSSPSPSLLPTFGRDPKGPSREAGERSAGRPIERSEVVQQRLAGRLGNGDAAIGWLLLGALSPSRQDALTAMERTGHLSETELAQARADADLARSSKAGGAG